MNEKGICKRVLYQVVNADDVKTITDMKIKDTVFTQCQLIFLNNGNLVIIETTIKHGGRTKVLMKRE